MYAVVAALSATTFLAAGLPHGVAELCAVLVSVVAGLLTGLVAIGRRGTTPLSSLIITFGVGIFAYAVEVLTWGDQPRSFPGLPGAIEIAGVRVQEQYVLVVVAGAARFSRARAVLRADLRRQGAERVREQSVRRARRRHRRHSHGALRVRARGRARGTRRGASRTASPDGVRLRCPARDRRLRRRDPGRADEARPCPDRGADARRRRGDGGRLRQRRRTRPRSPCS